MEKSSVDFLWPPSHRSGIPGKALPMARPWHIGWRMSQRGTRQALIDPTLQFGETAQEKCVLGRKGLERLLEELRQIERTAMQAIDKGGVVVVQADGAQITTYNLDSHDRRVHAR
jgi:hypothetical protein